MHVMVSGLPGSGKGLWSQYLIHDVLLKQGRRWADPARNSGAFHKRMYRDGRVACFADVPDVIYSSIGLKGHLAPNVVISDTEQMMSTKKPGIYYIDEMQDYFPARGFKEFSKAAIKWWTQHRKFDAFIISNTQHPEFVDKICQILTDEVHIPTLHRIPFIGWFYPKCVRPPQVYDEEKGRDRHYRRDALGDRSHWVWRFLGFGTLMRVRVWPPSILGGEKDLTPKEIEKRGQSKKIRTHWRLFNIDFANRYASGHL